MPQKSINFLIGKYGNINYEHATIYSYILANSSGKGSNSKELFWAKQKNRNVKKERENWWTTTTTVLHFIQSPWRKLQDSQKTKINEIKTFFTALSLNNIIKIVCRAGYRIHRKKIFVFSLRLVFLILFILAHDIYFYLFSFRFKFNSQND